MPTKVQDPLKYRIVVRYSEEDAGYIAVVPELRGCSAWGKTESAAIRAVKEAASAWLKAAKANKIEIPTPLDEKQVTGKFAVKEAATAWLKAAKANKIEIPTPLDEKQVTGKFALRMPPELHKELVFEAKVQGSSLNQYIVYKLSKAKG